MKVPYIIGADLAKDSIDFVCHQSNSHIQISNCKKGFGQLLSWIRGQKINTAVIVMEHTGHCSDQLEDFLHKHHIRFAKVPALAIKRSLGLTRGKNDKIDAKRIARYGFEKWGQLVMTSKPNPTLERLQMLHSTRQFLVKHRASLITSFKEFRAITKQTNDVLLKSRLKLIKDFTQQIKAVEAEIEVYMAKETDIKGNYRLLKSIKGVGKVVATAAIVKTGNFTRFTDGRKFSCYSGSAPFEHSSGKSIRRKTRVSHLADKEMKALLDRAANTAIQHDKEIKAYYERRLEMGKPKKSTINVVRNKIIHRMFAVIKRQTPFITNYMQTA